MSDKTSIEWADATWNPIRGTVGRWSCIKISPGCANCYAERLNVQFGGPKYAVGADTLRLDEEVLTQPLQWKRPRRIFVCSMTDLFEERVSNEQIAAIFGVMADASQHIFLVLTKRAERMHSWFQWMESPSAGKALMAPRPGAIPYAIPYGKRGAPAPAWPLPNVWLGVSAENQQYADERIPWLFQTPAAVLFVSLEPLLGPIGLRRYLERLHWVIAGGESGGQPERALVSSWKDGRWVPKPQALTWIRSILDQCQVGRVPFFFKQWGGPTPKAGGRLLDGQERNEYP